MKAHFDDLDYKGLDDSLLSISDNWIKRGEYYYYTKPVDRGGFCRIYGKCKDSDNLG